MSELLNGEIPRTATALLMAEGQKRWARASEHWDAYRQQDCDEEGCGAFFGAAKDDIWRFLDFCEMVTRGAPEGTPR